MKVSKDVYIEGELIENSTIKIYYKGIFVREFSNEVYIVFGYGTEWNNIQEQKMTWIGDCFLAEVYLKTNGFFNFCFRNDYNSWDNNNFKDYSILVNSEIIEKNIEDYNDESVFEKDEDIKYPINDDKLEETLNKMKEFVNWQETKNSNNEIYLNKNKFDSKDYIHKSDTKNRYKRSKNKNDKKKIKYKKRYKKENKKRKKIIRIICKLILIICILYFLIYYFKIKYIQNENYNLLNSVKINNTIFIQTDVNNENNQNKRVLQVKELSYQYPEIKGWIEIEGTNINYPVMQGNDNDYYITHDYKKESSRWGALFADKDYDWDIPSSNLLIYGHNFSDGIMFSDLLKYKDKSFFDDNPIIKFTTTEEDCEYEIISVFYSRVYYKSEKNVFRYYFFVNAENETEYNEFVNNAKKASIYDTGKTAEYGDELMTLSTCEYSQEDGRFVIVARKK